MSNYFEKDPNKIRLNVALRLELISKEQHDRIKEYLDSEEEDVYKLGAESLKGIIKNSAKDGINPNN